MTFQSFLEKWDGKFIDFDGVYNSQCMDLMHIYCVEVLGLTDGSILAAACAKDVYNNFQNVKGNELFDRIENTPTGVPQEGDVMFWGNGTWGHVAIFMEGDENQFTSFDQNYPTGSPCHAQSHNYTGVLGWLRLKESATASLQAELDKARIARDEHWNELQRIADKLGVQNSETVIMGELTKLISYEDSVVQKDKALSEAQTQLVDLKNQVSALLADNYQLKLDIGGIKSEMDRKVSDFQTQLNDRDSKINDLSRAIESLKKACSPPVFKGFKQIIYNWLMS